jgi:hypothetical protein
LWALLREQIQSGLKCFDHWQKFSLSRGKQATIFMKPVIANHISQSTMPKGTSSQIPIFDYSGGQGTDTSQRVMYSGGPIYDPWGNSLDRMPNFGDRRADGQFFHGAIKMPGGWFVCHRNQRQ